MNVHDWLWNLPISDVDSACKIVKSASTRGVGKIITITRRSSIMTRATWSLWKLPQVFDVGEVSLTGELVRLQLKKKNISEFDPDMKKILRRST
jgi:hypothetical protein